MDEAETADERKMDEVIVDVREDRLMRRRDEILNLELYCV